jgi:hypothetical protein
MHSLAMLAGGASLVLREKVINPEGPCYVKLVGRKAGLMDWLLTLIGINTTTTLEVFEDRIEYSYGSLSGRVLEVIPLSQVSNLVCGYFKPVLLLFLAVLSLPLVIVTFGVSLILTALLVFFYFFKKSTLISIIPASSSAASVAFKRSLIENKNITEEEAAQIIKLVAELVEKANQR